MTNLILLVLKSTYLNVFKGLKMFYKGGGEGFRYHSNISHPLPAMQASLCKALKGFLRLPRSEGFSKLIEKVSTATSCTAVVRFINNTLISKKYMFLTPTKADKKQRADIASDPATIQECSDHRLSTRGATVNLKIQGKLRRRLSPTFEREKFCLRRSNGRSFTWNP